MATVLPIQWVNAAETSPLWGEGGRRPGEGENPLFSLTLRVSMLAVVLLASTASAQRNLKNIPPPDPQLELEALQVHEGFEVNLFAGDPAIAKPIQMNFDERGRLWVATSEVYPQIEPGQKADDKILILEDRDGDGRAEQHTVFARGLLIPTGVAPGDGGAYVANSTELIHLADTDGDGRADRREIVLSGFGTEDTHHILHTLRWGPGGALYMNQSIYIHSHIETPYGVRRMNGGGVWRFRLDTLELETFTLGLVNSWGHHFDRFGQSFQTDGAGGDGINYVYPGWVGVTSPGAKRVMRGLNPGSPKHCGLEILSGRHLPPEWRGSLLTNDFRAHRVCRFVLSDDGSGFASRQQKELIKTTHVAFRPIDIKMGPDGAIYIADWYNPIIQHGEVDFRDPRRDHTHGRIWRVTAKGRPLVPRVNLAEASIAQLLESLKAPERLTRLHAKRVLMARGKDAVLPKLRDWVASLADADSKSEHHLLEALWTYQSLRVVEPKLLARLMRAEDPRVRAGATRVLYDWHDRVEQPLELLAEQVGDPHPRVRLEALHALRRIRRPEACEIATRVLQQPMDENLDFALWTTVRELEDAWLPALERGEIDFGGALKQLTFALRAVESKDVVPLLIRQLRDGSGFERERQANLVESIAALGTPEQLGEVLKLAFDTARPPAERSMILDRLSAVSAQNKRRPDGDLSQLSKLLDAEDASLRKAAIQAVGRWRLEEHRDLLAALLAAEETGGELLEPSVDALASIGAAHASSRAQVKELLTELAAGELRPKQPASRVLGLTGLAQLDRAAAAARFGAVFSSTGAEADPRPAVEAFLAYKNGPAALAGALQDRKLPPDVAKLALRSVRSSGQAHPELEAALITAGDIQEGPRRLTPEEMQRFLELVRSPGDPARGEAVYRRKELGCLKCHAIGGAGGRVGPDLSSIGTSAQPDYLVESLLDPGKKIKENYHSVIVQTDEGKVLTGVKLRQTDRELILRDAEDRELRVPLESIEAQRDGGSLMPAGLAGELTRRELADLVRFLSELGKVGGEFAVGKEQIVRRWRVLPPTPENYHAIGRKGFDTVPAGNPELQWEPAYSKVSGELPLADLPALSHRRVEGKISFAQFELETTSGGRVRLEFADPAGLSAWLNGAPIRPSAKTALDLSPGRNVVTLQVSRAKRSSPLRVAIENFEGSTAGVQIVGGR